MRDSFIIIISLAICTPARCTDVGRDGFNFYKDYIRARYDEGIEDYPEVEPRVLYFYRTPLQNMYPRVLPVLDQEHTKRTENIFKNHMINKDYIDKPRGKRTSKAGLSQLMLIKHGESPIDSGHYCPYGK